jgi:CheY-like chemotaxis protein
MLQKMHESQTAPDLILTDLSLLKGPDGIGIISQLRDHFRTNIPGVLISGTTDPDKLKQARSSGYRLVQKPINPSELRSLVQHQLYAHH